MRYFEATDRDFFQGWSASGHERGRQLCQHQPGTGPIVKAIVFRGVEDVCFMLTNADSSAPGPCPAT